MIFNSLHFALFLPVVLVLVTMLRTRVTARNWVLLIASYYFYGMWDWRFLGLLVLTTVIDWGVGLWLGSRPPDDGHDPREHGRRRRVLAISIVTNLLVLGVFKYFDFFAQSLSDGLHALGLNASLPLLHVVLPVGISFYTFQSMSYTIDVYRGDLPPERSLMRFALYVAFFPQLVAGPIERATTLIRQVDTVRTVRREDVFWGFHMVCWGLFKKVVLADNAALVADKVFEASSPGGVTVLLGVYAFAVQIYCDFSGYSDIARGCAKMMGFDLMVNFNLPYLATNPSDFWKRWHISLSTWLRDYLYIPLGGSRGGAFRTNVNLMLTMFLGGLWHGAAWNFVFWGVFHGTLLCAHRAAQPHLARWVSPQTPGAVRLWWLVRVFVFFQVTCIGWLLFRAHSAEQIGSMLSALATRPTFDSSVLTATDLLTLGACGATLLAVQVAQHTTRDMYVAFRIPVPARSAIYAAAILGFALFGNYAGVQFIYFQF